MVIDEVHTLIGAGAAEGAIDAANILKPALARGELQCIGATTLDEYRKHIERDAALERRFQPVMVGEPSIAETIEILHGLRERYEQHHRLKITDEALEAAANLGDRYISDRFLPDKAIDLIDEAGSRVRLLNSKLPPEAKEVDKELRKVQKEKEEAVRDQNFTQAGELREKEVTLREKIRTLLQSSRENSETNQTSSSNENPTEGTDFLSPCLSEAESMSKTMERGAFPAWLDTFLPPMVDDRFAPLRTPPVVLDPEDPGIGHLIGLMFHRAWTMNQLASVLPESDTRREIFLRLAAIHAREGYNIMFDSGYGGEHWLATFAVYMMSEYSRLNDGTVTDETVVERVNELADELVRFTTSLNSS